MVDAVAAGATVIFASHEQDRVEDAAAEQHAQSMLEDTANLILGLR